MRTDRGGGKLILLVTMMLLTTVSTWLCNERVHAIITAIYWKPQDQNTMECYNSVENELRIVWKRTVVTFFLFLVYLFCTMALYFSFVIGYGERSLKTRDDTWYLATKKTQFWTHVWIRRSKNLTLTEHVNRTVLSNDMRPWSVSFPLAGAWLPAPIMKTQQQKYKQTKNRLKQKTEKVHFL